MFYIKSIIHFFDKKDIVFFLAQKKHIVRFEKLACRDIIRLNSGFQLIKIAVDVYESDLTVLERNLGLTFNA